MAFQDIQAGRWPPCTVCAFHTLSLTLRNSSAAYWAHGWLDRGREQGYGPGKVETPCSPPFNSPPLSVAASHQWTRRHLLCMPYRLPGSLNVCSSHESGTFFITHSPRDGTLPSAATQATADDTCRTTIRCQISIVDRFAVAKTPFSDLQELFSCGKHHLFEEQIASGGMYILDCRYGGEPKRSEHGRSSSPHHSVHNRGWLRTWD